MIEQNYSIKEILLAVDEIQNKKRTNKLKLAETGSINKNNSDIPVNTLKLIEEAEKIKD
jgi:hypothetical protein|tara:strand:- start:401 stop:577 length:177 start_codon:yes stop_codon:yes gene_type:complete